MLLLSGTLSSFTRECDTNLVFDDWLTVVSSRGTCQWQIHDSAVSGRVDFVFYYGFEGAGYEIPSRVYYDPARQAKGCKSWLEWRYVLGRQWLTAIS